MNKRRARVRPSARAQCQRCACRLEVWLALLDGSPYQYCPACFWWGWL